jgi:hypothetical protein
MNPQSGASTMLLATEIIRILLITCFLGMGLVAMLYLRQRRLPMIGYACWGLVALLIPLIGPFLLIMSHPGEKCPVSPAKKDRLSKNT